ncbi:MAG TPA: membrane protein insertase YidC, partial [Rubrivivax sp.]|nr:membrane protein insertase YidC [Rubrivivax sp.]
MRRTLLWVVFTMSLVLLWDKWTVHTGQPSMFGAGGGARSAASAPAAAASPVAGVPTAGTAAV